MDAYFKCYPIKDGDRYQTLVAPPLSLYYEINHQINQAL